jgi:hypothetical protein
LDTEQLQGIFAIAIDQICLEFPEAPNLPCHVGGIGEDCRQRDYKPKEQAKGRRTVRRRRAGHVLRIQRQDGGCHRRRCVTMQ